MRMNILLLNAHIDYECTAAHLDEKPYKAYSMATAVRVRVSPKNSPLDVTTDSDIILHH